MSRLCRCDPWGIRISLRISRSDLGLTGAIGRLSIDDLRKQARTSGPLATLTSPGKRVGRNFSITPVASFPAPVQREICPPAGHCVDRAWSRLGRGLPPTYDKTYLCLRSASLYEPENQQKDHC